MNRAAYLAFLLLIVAVALLTCSGCVSKPCDKAPPKFERTISPKTLIA